ncbi:MAG: hypothetical protein OXN17_18635 [Candidatus Poribacteria bacterium]|nr:hypothetical protein [Candidatus Poribacteria bacterium]MDE0506486.1 hypothetical protein [Candidatus Poribacteria bacterium]
MKGMYVSAICWLFIVHYGFAVPEDIPPDVIQTQRDRYFYADYPGVFDDPESEGITVEAWIYLTDQPKDGNYRDTKEGRWIVLAKPGSYHVTITGRDLGSPARRDDQEGLTYMWFSIERAVGNSWGAAGSGVPIAPEEFPLRRWVHVAHQIVVQHDEVHNIQFYGSVPCYDRKCREGTRRRFMGRENTPLVIGGPAPVTLNDIWEWDKRFESMEGYIDEVRVSKGARYGEEIGEEIRPRRRLRADERTLALWRFDEGPGSRTYQDSSGNGYTLFAGGSLATAVDSRGKLATTWGSLKQRAQDIK